MSSADRIAAYLGTVCDQIRWKRARGVVRRELESHIADQRNAYQAQGMDEETAADQALAQMGDPVEAGLGLDRAHRPRPQWGMLGMVVLLLGIGVLLGTALLNDKITPALNAHSLPQVLLGGVVGVPLLVLVYLADFTILGKRPMLIYWGGKGACLVLRILSGADGSGNTQFLTLLPGASVTIVPLTLCLPLLYALAVYAQRGRGMMGILLCGLAILPPALLSLWMPSLASAVLVLVSGLILLTVAIVKGWFGCKKLHGLLLVYLPTLAAVAVPLLAVWKHPGFQRRLDLALYPNRYLMNMTQAGAENARLLEGAALPTQYPKAAGLWMAFRPSEISTDMLLTYVIGTFGWLVFGLILGVMAFFAIRGFVLCAKQRSILGLLVSLAVLLTFTLQTIGYVAYNLGFMLLSPLSLPLISYGSTATVVNLALIGLMLSVFRGQEAALDAPGKPLPVLAAVVWEGKRLTIDFGKKG